MKTFFRNKNTLLTISFFIGFTFMPFFIPSFSDTGTAYSIIGSWGFTNLLLILCPVLLAVFMSRKTTENESFTLLSFTYIVLLLIIYTDFGTAQATLLFNSVTLLLLSVICINAGQPVTSLVLIPGLFLRSLGTGYLLICYVPVLLMLAMNFSRSGKEEKKSLILILGAYLYTVVFAVLLFAKGKLTVSLSPVKPDTSAVDVLHCTAGCLLAVTCCILFIIRVLPSMKKGSVLFRLSAVLFALFPVAGGVAGFLTGIISSRPETVFLVTLLIYITGNINISLQTKEAPSVLPRKNGNIILLFCCIAMCMLVF